MSHQLLRYGNRQPYRMTVQPGTSDTLVLDSGYHTPFLLALKNTSTAPAVTSAVVRLVDDGIAAPLGINETGTLAAGAVATLAFPCAVRSITVSQPAEADGEAVLEVLQ